MLHWVHRPTGQRTSLCGGMDALTCDSSFCSCCHLEHIHTPAQGVACGACTNKLHILLPIAPVHLVVAGDECASVCLYAFAVH